MTDAPSLLRACRDNPGDFTLYLIAADFFAASDEGDAPDLERALRWMASHQKHPHEVANSPTATDSPLASKRCWIWVSPVMPANSPVSPFPESSRLPMDVYKAIQMRGNHRRYHAWTAALFDLAAALAKATP